ncbi:hypothetical protein M0804_007705 [Polistes exclamans]|nr:hypothetical protein M0804_007705 [Polistes exclamans]
MTELSEVSDEGSAHFIGTFGGQLRALASGWYGVRYPSPTYFHGLDHLSYTTTTPPPPSTTTITTTTRTTTITGTIVDGGKRTRLMAVVTRKAVGYIEEQTRSEVNVSLVSLRITLGRFIKTVKQTKRFHQWYVTAFGGLAFGKYLGERGKCFLRKARPIKAPFPYPLQPLEYLCSAVSDLIPLSVETYCPLDKSNAHEEYSTLRALKIVEPKD